MSKPQDDPTSASAVDASSTQLIPSLAEQSSNQATVQVPDSVPDPFLYVNQSYAPAPDELLDNLYSCFGADNKLVLHYSKTQAWG
ncbi:hypothetical protein HAZT_HAZT010868 [Hyalella azteca]|uniref:Ubiquitin-like protein ATG12 n=1 Tax=Hyalella azteca TaxID=294128 RepID=A0A6A0H0Z0_HYAAZ|nr:hypothetical protein HAZT_HAZT010868 [Hyalella azteca]